MNLPAARVTDPHRCPTHGPSPLSPPGQQDVVIGNQRAARAGDAAACPPRDFIVTGASTVWIGNRFAARSTDATSHGGSVANGCRTVLIGGPVGGWTLGDPDRAANFFPGQQANKDTCALMSTEGVVHQQTGTPRTEAQMQEIGTASGEYAVCNGTTDEAAVMTQAGIPATLSEDPSLNDIAQAVAEGRAVIVGLDARPIWGSNSPNPLGHAVRVTGVEYDADGNIYAFRVNDTGTGQANQQVRASTMQQSLDGFDGGRMATSNSPVP